MAKIISLLLFLCANLFATPQIEVMTQKVIDFGSYPANQSRTGTFEIVNKGDSDLTILKTRATCGCAVAAMTKTKLSPGEKTSMSLTIKAQSIDGPFAKNAFIISDDPNNRYLKVTVKGNAKTIIDVKPKKIINVGRLNSGETREVEFLINADVKNVIFGDPIITSKIPIDLIFKKSSKNHYVLTAKLHANDIGGKLNANINIPIKSPTGWRPIDLKIQGRLGDALLIAPRTIAIPKDSPPINRTIIIREIGGARLDTKKLTWTAPKGVTVNQLQAQRGMARMKINISSNFAQDSPAFITFNYPHATPAILNLTTANH